MFLSDARPTTLVALAREGDERAWSELVSRHTGLVWSVARAHGLGDVDAADVAQATWVKLFEHVADIRDARAISGWIATTTRRECLKLVRRRARVVCTDETPELVDDRPGPEARMLSDERDVALWAALRRLPGRDQALLRILAAEPAPSYQDVSAALGMPIGSIGPTRARALDRLRRELERR